MKDRITQFFFRRIPLLIFLTFYLLFTIFTYRDYGLTMDEFFVYTRGEYFYTKVKGNDPLLQKGFAIKERANHNLLYYNSTYPAVLYAINDSHSYESYHLLNMLFASLSFCFLYEILLLGFKNSKYAILGPIFLFLTPRFLGHIPANPKDIPFAVLYVTSLFFIYIQHILNPRIRTLLIGLNIGLTASLRMVGFSLLPVYFVYVLLVNWKSINKHWFKEVTNLVLESVQIFIISFFMFMLSMPYVAADPFNHTIELLKVNKIYPWFGTVFFMRETYNQDQIPLHYLPVWLLVTTPVFILVLSVVSFFKKLSKELNGLRLLLTISLGIQIVMYLLLKPIIYNGLRHYLFFLPQLVLLAIIGFYSLRTSRKWFKFVTGLTILNTIFVLWYYLQFHPYQYTYFNLLGGTIYKASSSFETDYWGASDREALIWLKSYSESQGENKPGVFLCSKSMALNYYFPEARDMNNNIRNADYIVCYDKRQLDELKKSVRGEIIHEVTRDGILFNSVYKVL